MTQRLLYFTLALFCCANTLVAQNFEWAIPFVRSGNTDTPSEQYKLAIDAEDNIFMLIKFNGQFDLDSTANEMLIGNGESSRSYLVKFDNTGKVLWHKMLTGNEKGYNYNGFAMTTDANGNVYITGQFENRIDFDPGTEDADTTWLEEKNGEVLFVQKLDNDGNLLWAKKYGDAGLDEKGFLNARSIKVTASNIYIAGYFNYKICFEEGNEAATHETPNYKEDILVLKLDMDGNYDWSYAAGGEGMDIAYLIDVDKDGDVYVSGMFEDEVDFAPGDNVNRLSGGSGSIFTLKIINKLPTHGTRLIEYVRSLTGAGDKHVTGLYVDEDERVMISGNFIEKLNCTPGRRIPIYIYPENRGSYEYCMFYVRYEPNHGSIDWAMSGGNKNEDAAYSPRNTQIIDGKCYSLEGLLASVRDTSLMRTAQEPHDSYIYKLWGGPDYWTDNSKAEGIDMVVGSDNSMYVLASFSEKVIFYDVIDEVWGDKTYCTEPGLNHLVLYKVKGVASSTKAHVVNEQPSSIAYPNPTNGMLYINNLNESCDNIQIYSTTGTLVKTVNGKGIQQVDMRDLDPGIYLLQLSRLNAQKKIVKVTKQ